jgi:nicotinamidase-related amidase
MASHCRTFDWGRIIRRLGGFRGPVAAAVIGASLVATPSLAVRGAAPGAGAAKLGIVLIDAQTNFVQRAATPNMPGVLAKTKATLELAAKYELPVFITYEGSKRGDHALTPALRGAVPPRALDFIKTTFAATGLPAFRAAVQRSGAKTLVVLGSETDVCVMQTVLELRRLGYDVLLQEDAVFSSESAPSPALRRMVQAGVVMVDRAAVAALGSESVPQPSHPADTAIPRFEPRKAAIVLNHLDEAAVSEAADISKAAKLSRLRELLLISEWFGLPVYADAPLPHELRRLVEKPPKPLAELASAKGVEQVVVAGTERGLEPMLAAYRATRSVFLVEDALLAHGPRNAQRAAGDTVPATYKMLYYEAIRSISDAEWPERAWVTRARHYADRIAAPEDLPPIRE